ncbi:KipI family sensor histidine kinase inhibitor [Arthrobacter stackebrandtii]|uniref:KipI family sensor histidine kinase inhibitor n=1 Tax=Arthrobacter stackebrandtii TaxID=272161 RepID=A0ABS4YXK0_9MICC|nr:KipI family sensor histidine kinase inhibitor [Arthrobacter stackebrandtii]
MRLLDVGELAVLAELDSLAQVMAVQAVLLRSRPPGVIDVVPAARTVLVSCDSPAAVRAVRGLLAVPPEGLPEPPPGAVHTIKTLYDGADLAHAAGLAGLSTEALVSWHSGQPWLAAFGGFAPGFMYLSPGRQALDMPRHPSPRTEVPAGSVAAGGGFSAIYPGPSPGGWQLLGRCADVLWDASLWDGSGASPALLQPGDTVQFVPVRELVHVSAAAPSTVSEPDSPGAGLHHHESGLAILSPGAFTTVQDLGRPGFAHLGVTASGALDRAALRRANRMVGNPAGRGAGAAGLETVLGGLRVRAVGSHVLAVAGSGAELAVAGVAGTARTPGTNAPFALLDGETLTVTVPTAASALRCYVAVRGGLSVPAALGSRSTDALSRLGPAPLAAGVFLPVGAPAGVVGLPEPVPEQPEIAELRYLPGPRHDWFTPESLAALEQAVWRVGADSNRIGLRVEPADPGATALVRTHEAATRELPSEGMADGAIQVPPSGMPVIFLADHPVTGGYPVVGVVLREDLGKAASLAPGARVRFRRMERREGRTAPAGQSTWHFAT